MEEEGEGEEREEREKGEKGEEGEEREGRKGSRGGMKNGKRALGLHTDTGFFPWKWGEGSKSLKWFG